MPGKFRKLARRFFIFFNILLVLLYLLVCLVPFLNAGRFWFIAILGLVFPLLLVMVIICLLVWLIRRSGWVFLSLGALLISWQQLSVVFGMHIEKEFNIDKPDGTIRVLSWNVSRWDEGNKKMRGGVSFRNLMLDLVEIQNADVLCFQEFFESYDLKLFEANIPVLERMGYPYHYFFPTSQIHQGTLHFGLCIFSRYPIIDSARFTNEAREHSEGLCYVDIKTQSQVVRIFTTHLESVGFGRYDYEELGSVKTSRNIAAKIRRGYQLRSIQAEMVRKEIESSPYPVIACGDIDDVPNSYAYFTVKGDLQDAFLKKGSGLGRTFRFISPTLRIDYIFADKRFKVRQYSRLKVPYSDHYPIIADLYFVEKQ
jgi:endonuclease/exonuclease/phosphatase family metal-dependent hydrolase